MTQWSQLIVIDMRWPTTIWSQGRLAEFCNLADAENESLRRINHGGATGTGDKSLEAGNKRSAFVSDIEL